jgi:hypothetical protein
MNDLTSPAKPILGDEVRAAADRVMRVIEAVNTLAKVGA